MADFSPAAKVRNEDITGTEKNRSQEDDTDMAATPSVRDQDGAEKQHNSSSTGARTTRSVTYCSVGVQTAPPRNAQEFQRIHGREPTDRELVSRMGTAAIGRFGLSANAHEIIHSASFPCPEDIRVATTYADASFQTADVAQCKMSIARTKAKASMMVNKQRRAALEAGYRVWSETKDEKTIHSEQFTLRVQFDQEGNATSGDVGSLLLPNIYGEEVNPRLPLPQPIAQSQQQELPHRMISFTKEVDPDVYTSNSGLTPPPTPPPAPLDDAARDRLHLRRVHTFAPSVPRDDTDPYSLEDYGYIRAVPEPNTRKGMKTEKEVIHDEAEEKGNIPETISRKDTGMLEVGGERFAEKFIVYDPAAFVAVTSAPSSFVPTSPRKRKAPQSDYESSRGSPKRSRTPNTQNLLDAPLHDRHIRGEERDFTTTAQPTSKTGRFSELPHKTERKEEEARQAEGRRGEKGTRAKEVGREAGTDRRRRSRSRSAHRTPKKDRTRARDMERSDRDPDHHRASRRRSRSPDSRVPRNDYRSRSRDRREAEDSYEAERQRNADRKKIQADNEAREAEERRREKEEERRRAREAEDRRHAEKEESRRAQEAEDKRKQEAEQKKKAREVEVRARHEEKERDRRRIEKEERRTARGPEESRRQEEKDQDRRRRRDRERERERSPDRRKDKERRKPDADTRKPAEQEDPYAKARAEEVAKREQAFKENNPEKPVRHTRDRSIERAKRPIKDEKHTEENAAKEDKKVSRPRPARTARGELERYDPRKKFGR